MEVEFKPVALEKETSIPSCCAFCICQSIFPSTWKETKKILYSFICFILTIISFITLCVSLGLSYIVIQGYPTHSSIIPGVWTSLISIFICSYSSYLLYYNKKLHFPSDKPQHNSSYLNQHKKRSWYLNLLFLLYLNLCSLIIIISGLIIRPLCLWYSGGSITWFIATFITFYRLVYTKLKHSPLQYQTSMDCDDDDDDNNDDEQSSLHLNYSESNCFKRFFDCCCLHCIAPIMLMIMASLIMIQSCFSANTPIIEGQLYRMTKDGYDYNLQAICKGIRTENHDFTIILMHGEGSNSLSMQPLQNQLKNGGFRSCAYTRPGFAWSDASPLPMGEQNYTVEEMFDLIQYVMKEPPPYVLIGHSVGGQIAKTAGYKYRDKLVGIILLDSVPGFRWEMIYGDISFKQVCDIYNRRKQLVDIARFATPFGLMRPFTYDESYGDYTDGQWWAFNLDSKWQSQWIIMQYQSLDYETLFNLESFYMKPYILDDLPLLSLPAGLNASCQQRGYIERSDECIEYRRQNEGFIEMHLDQIKTSNDSEMIICPHPCGHAFVWTESKWIFEKIKPYLTRW